MPSSEEINRLLNIMGQLRDPEKGCPWDLEQSFKTIAPYTIEEAYEVADAIQRGEKEDLREELGDLLFQVVYHARLAEEKGWFDFNEVAAGINDKLIRRHPHVFGNEKIADAQTQTLAWEAHKSKERKQKENGGGSEMDGIPVAMPALTRAHKLQKRASRVGFDWPSIHGVLDKVSEELGEMQAALESGDNCALEEEIGDLLFTSVNVARHGGVDPETVLRMANQKFETRFRFMEQLIQQQHRSLNQIQSEELEELWEAAKHSI